MEGQGYAGVITMPRILKRLDRPTTLPTTPHHDERGQVAFGFMLLMVVVFMFFALAVDTGIWALDHRTAQNQVDAAAHAGALALMDGGNATVATNAAREWLSKNGVPTPSANLCPSDTGDYWIRVDEGQQRVEICQRRDSEVVFSALTGVVDIKVSAGAVARVQEISTFLPYSIMVMNEDDCGAFTLSGQAFVTVDGGETYIRSDCNGNGNNKALIASGQAGIESEGNDLVGGYRTTGQASFTPEPNPTSWMDDPFGGTAQPTIPSGLPTRSTSNISGQGNVTLDPGRYPNGLSMSGQGRVTFRAGTYVFENNFQVSGQRDVVFGEGIYIFRRGFDLSGQGDLEGDNVLFYHTCRNASPCNGASLSSINYSGQGDLDLSSRDEFNNVVVWVDRTAGGSSTVQMSGQSNWDIDGILYAVDSQLRMSGQGSQALTLNMSIIVDTLEMSGQASIGLPWDEDHAIGGTEQFIALVE